MLNLASIVIGGFIVSFAQKKMNCVWKRNYWRFRQRCCSILYANQCRTSSEIQFDRSTGKAQTSHSSYQLVVGLEIHAQLDVATKLFSSAPTSGVAAPNQNLHPFDAAVPGTLPLLNEVAVHKAVLAAAALQCTIHPISRFERKHYLYADLPHGYQITQQRWPLATDGVVQLDDDGAVNSKKAKKSNKRSIASSSRILRLQLEMDTAKTIGTPNSHHQRIDFNRAGCPLIEIVTAPDIYSSDDATRVVTTIRSLLQHTGSCDGRMEHGHFRVDCNINLRDTTTTTPRVEVKNLNSILQVRQAIQYEAQRQATALATGTPLQSETRTWNAVTQQTIVMRRKDQADDYRFVPEPDIPPLLLDASTLAGSPNLTTFLHDHLPELPRAIRQRLQTILPPAVAHQLSLDPRAVRFFDQGLEYCSSRSAKALGHLLCNEVVALGEDVYERLSARQVGQIVHLVVDQQRLSKTMAKRLLHVLYHEEGPEADAAMVAQQRGWELITDTDTLRALCREVMEAHPDELQVYRKGGKFVGKMEKLFTGKVMQASQGNAHPERLGEVVKECLVERTALDSGE